MNFDGALPPVPMSYTIVYAPPTEDDPTPQICWQWVAYSPNEGQAIDAVHGHVEEPQLVMALLTLLSAAWLGVVGPQAELDALMGQGEHDGS